MNTNYLGVIGVTAVLLLVVGVGAYQLGIRQASQPTPAASTIRLPDASTPAAPVAPAPTNSALSGTAGANPQAKFTHFRVGQRNVKSILVDGDLVWVGTSGGAIRYNSKTDDYRLFDNRSGLLANGVFHVDKLSERIAVGTYGGGLALQNPDGESWEIFNVPDGLGDAFIYGWVTDTAGDVWIATWSGVNRVRGGALNERSQWDLFTVENTRGGLPNDWVYGLALGKNGELWMATEGGLARYQDGQWRNWKHEDGLGAAFETVKEDIKYTDDPAKVSEHHARQKEEMGLQDVDVAYNPNYIVSLQVDQDGSVWAGTWGGGLAHFDGSNWKNYTMSNGLPANHVFALHQDHRGRLWVGTSKGLALREGEGFRTFTTADGLYSNAVFSIATAANDTLWVGSFGGVARLVGLQ